MASIRRKYSQFKKLKLDPNAFKVYDIEVSFGMKNLYNWMVSKEFSESSLLRNAYPVILTSPLSLTL
ncbi:hypothetical protein HMI54_008843 [Coelomomyces lativittatus]|nr:hypothetical protein HMI54_008843 [Coelomomyces lativittatus]KAJ1508889.1 hypothetical protein HMI56_007062 [Coelomomyces lativittatus]